MATAMDVGAWEVDNSPGWVVGKRSGSPDRVDSAQTTG
jgi:hypothetical protein